MKIWNGSLDLGVRTDLIKQVKTYVESFSDILTKVVLFGSTARGDFSDDSDIDLYIESDFLTECNLLRSERFTEFTLGLYALAGNKTEFDLLTFGKNTIKSSGILYENIEKDGFVLYDKRAESF